MTDRQLYLLSPYRPPTSYPVTLNTDEAAAWLNGYAALWHPAALAGAGRPPEPASAYDHDRPVAGAVYALPQGPQLYQPDDWPARAAEAKAVAFAATGDRVETFANLARALEEAGGPTPLLSTGESLVRAFTGVGYGYLMLDTLFEAMSHDRLLDAAGFWADVTAAVTAAGRPDGSPEAFAALTAAAEKLRSAREGLHAGSINLMDWVVLTGGPPPHWPASIAGGLPAVLIAPAEALEQLAADHPDRFAGLKARVPADLAPTVDVCSGAYRDRDDAVLPIESQFWTLLKSRAAVAALFGREPSVFARWRSAYHPQLPSWLQHAGYRHAVATNFDGALVPNRYAAVINWPAPDGRAVEAFAKDPLPAHDPQTFFNLGYHLHQAITQDSSPTVVLLHRGNTPGAGYDDWLALSGLAPVLGRWTTLSDYLSDAPAGEYSGPAPADEFFADYLDDRVTTRHRPDPVSGFARHHRLRRRLDAAFTLAALYRSLAPEAADEAGLLADLAALEDAVETRGPDVGPADAPDELSAKLEPVEAAWAKKLADRVQSRSADGRPGVLVFNPVAATRRVALELDRFPGPVPVGGAVKASEFDGGVARVVVEVPGLGFAWVPRGGGGAAEKPRIKTADGTTVRNEYFEADLDPATGGLRGFRDARTRVNRLGQVLVFNPGSRMRATAVRVTHAGAALGEVTSEGVVVGEHDEPLAAFRQRIRAWVGRPALELRIELTPTHRPTGYPWHAFYGARFAWRDDRAALFRGVNGANAQTTYPRPGSADYVEVRLGGQRTFVFTGGLPFVQRHGTRMFDVVLCPEGETATSFDFLLAFDREHPMQTAAGWAAPAPAVWTEKGPPPGGGSGWLAHLDLPSLLLTALRPAAPALGGGRAVVARVVETAGYGGAAELRFARDPARAWVADAAGAPAHEVTLTAGGVPVEFSAGEVVTVRAEWGA